MTDSATILGAVGQVNQKTGVPVDAPPNQPPAATTVTLVDGVPTNATIPPSRRSFNSLNKRYNGYEQVFSGSGTAPDDRDAAIEGTAYLTFTVLPNSTYDVSGCLDYCSSITTCVFVNLYYEFNNYQLDFVVGSNLKCAAYADVHTAAEKINWGHQQSYFDYGQPPPLTYMQDSTGWAADSLVDPETPTGYELVYGPTGGANNAPGYMGFAFLDQYDVNACAQLCNTRGPDQWGGACQYFNIWRAVVDGNPTTYTCSMYYLVADPSTATNYGQGSLVVTWARGYRRKHFVSDDDFESDDTNWQTHPSSSIVHDATIAYEGTGAGSLGPANSGPVTLSPAQPLNTNAGDSHILTFFASSQPTVAGSSLSGSTTAQVLWNGSPVLSIAPQTTNWAYYSISLTAQGNDVLAFEQTDGTTSTLVDNVYMFQQ